MNLEQIATKADVNELLSEIKKLNSTLATVKTEQKFLRSSDVRKMLNISDGTLQRLRTSGALVSQKVNGTWFYKLTDIQKLMEAKNEK